MAEPKGLLVIWSSGDREVALSNAFMYTYNSKVRGWWEKVRLIIWGPSATLLVQDEELQAYVKKMQDEGIEVWACVTCANMLGVTEQLEALDVEVLGTGIPTTKMLKEGWACLTY